MHLLVHWVAVLELHLTNQQSGADYMIFYLYGITLNCMTETITLLLYTSEIVCFNNSFYILSLLFPMQVVQKSKWQVLSKYAYIYKWILTTFEEYVMQYK